MLDHYLPQWTAPMDAHVVHRRDLSFDVRNADHPSVSACELARLSLSWQLTYFAKNLFHYRAPRPVIAF